MLLHPRTPTPLTLAPALLAALLLTGLPAACGGSGGPGTQSSVPTGGLVLLDPDHAEEPDRVHMGTIRLGEIEQRTLQLRNDDGRALTIRRIQAGCSCTRVLVSTTDERGQRVEGDSSSRERILVVPADGLVELTLRVDSNLSPTKNQEKVVIVSIITDSPTNPYLALNAQMKIEAPFQVVPPTLDMRKVARNAGGLGEVTIVAVQGSRSELVELLETPGDLEAVLEYSPRAGAEAWVLRARLLPPLPLGPRSGTLRVSVRGPDGDERPLEVPFSASVVPDVEVVPARLLIARPFDADDGGEDGPAPEFGEVEIFAHLPGQRLAIKKARLEGDGTRQLRIELTPADTDDSSGAIDGARASRWRVRLVATGELGSAALSGRLILELDDPQVPELVVPYMRRGS